jgi:hypothetical protein
MHASARTPFATAIAMTSAATIALSPLALPPDHRLAPLPHVGTVVTDVALTASAADVDAFIANLQAALDGVTSGATALSGIPAQNLIGTVDNIVSSLHTVFDGLIGVTANPTIAASLTIVKTLSVDAFAKLAENLGRINGEITATTAQVGDLVTTALTGSLRNAALAVVGVVNDPLSPSSYAGLATAGLATGQLLAANGLRGIQAIGDGGFHIAGIALSEVTFQFDNAVSRLGTLLTQLGDASGNAVVAAVVNTVQSFTISPALTVVNAGSSAINSVLTTANAGFDAVLGGVIHVVDPTTPAPADTGTTTAARTAVAATQTTRSAPATAVFTRRAPATTRVSADAPDATPSVAPTETTTDATASDREESPKPLHGNDVRQNSTATPGARTPQKTKAAKTPAATSRTAAATKSRTTAGSGSSAGAE